MLSKFIPVFAGVAAGVITSLAISRAAPRDDSQERAAAGKSLDVPVAYGPAAREARIRSGENSQQEVRLRHLERRLDELDSASKDDAADHPSPQEPEKSPEERRALLTKEHQDAIDAHFREPLDAKWATSTKAMFERDLTAITEETGMKVVSVDCKTQSCAATFEWASFKDAANGYSAVLHRPYEANCMRRILLPEPEEPTATYQATAIFECGDRQTQVPPQE